MQPTLTSCLGHISCYALPMDEKRYHAVADATLMHCFDQLEDAFESGTIDELELQGGILTIRSLSARTYLLTKHVPSLQLWYASPSMKTPNAGNYRMIAFFMISCAANLQAKILR